MKALAKQEENSGVISMWLVLLILICGAAGAWIPEYALYFVLFPSLVGVTLYLLTLKWYEAIFVIIFTPVLIACLF